MARVSIGIRIDEAVLRRVDVMLQNRNITRTSLVESLLVAASEGRLTVAEKVDNQHPSAFPAEQIDLSFLPCEFDPDFSDLSPTDVSHLITNYGFRGHGDACNVFPSSTICYSGTWYRVQRFAFALYNKRTPRQSRVLSTCHNNRCVNPSHLFLSTTGEPS